MDTFSVIILVLLAIILFICIIFIWVVNQGFKAKDNIEELKKNRNKVQW